MNYREIMKEIFTEGLTDPKRLTVSLGVDAVGVASAAAYLGGPVIGLIGEATDIVTAPTQTGWIIGAYGKDLTLGQKLIVYPLSFVEEIMPIIDIVPSCTLAHGLAAYNRIKKRNSGVVE